MLDRPGVRERAEDAARRYRAGDSLDVIAADCGVSRTAVWYWLKALQVRRRGKVAAQKAWAKRRERKAEADAPVRVA